MGYPADRTEGVLPEGKTSSWRRRRQQSRRSVGAWPGDFEDQDGSVSVVGSEIDAVQQFPLPVPARVHVEDQAVEIEKRIDRLLENELPLRRELGQGATARVHEPGVFPPGDRVVFRQERHVEGGFGRGALHIVALDAPIEKLP